ncbi:MAG: translation initiation factor 2 [Micromonosporaceae bacterium]
MTTPDPDAYWRRPANGDSPPAAGAAREEAPPGYDGPPPNSPPPTGWRTPTVAEPHAPRTLPEQDEPVIEEAEREARTVTYGVGIVAGAIVLVLLFVVCARLIG